MKAKKTYGIHGLLEWHGTIHSNGLKMRVDFTNGSTTAYGVAPATFVTKDELTQNIIEHSEEFKSGRIKLIRTLVLEEDKKAAPAAADKKPDVKEYPDVTKTQEARDILVNNHGVTQPINSKADAKRIAAELNVSFPNL